MAKDVTIRAQTLGGTWETIGTQYETGVFPENVSLEADDWGSSVASFDLRRDGRVSWPDLTAFTPVEVEVGGTLVWSGRVKETPIRDGADRSMSVQCEGWQAQLDDRKGLPFYVHSDLSAWKDLRAYPTAPLAVCIQAGQVSSDGTIVIGFPNGTPIPANEPVVGVILDLGPFATCEAISVDWESSNNTTQFTVVAQNQDTPNPLDATKSTAFSWVMNTGASGTTTGTFATPRRYVSVLVYDNTSTAHTIGADVTLKIKGIRVFGSAADQSAGQSTVKAPEVIRNAITQNCPLLSSDLSRIDPDATITFNIPSLAFLTDPKTSREVWTAVDAYHNYLRQIDVDKRAVYLPRPSEPVVEVNGTAWSDAEMEDASANSGEDIYNAVWVTGNTPDGQTVTVVRTITDTRADQRGFRRDATLSVSSPLPSDLVAADLLGDTFLTGHGATPFRGTATITGPNSVRQVPSGRDVPPETLLLMTSQLMRFSDRVDPNTGVWGRDGRIAKVTYTPADDKAVVTIDNTRSDLDALLARMAVVTGSA